MLTISKKQNGVPAFLNVFDELFNTQWPEKYFDGNGIFKPSVNVTETGSAYKIDFAVPGFSKEDFQVHVEKEFLSVSAQKEENKETKEGKVTRREFSFGSFKRTFTLPEHVETGKIDATYENGILSVVLPKKEAKYDASIQKITVK